MYSTHDQGKSVVAERFIRTLKNKIYKYMTSVSKNVYINKLADIVDKKSSTYIDFNENNNKKDPKFKVGDNVRVSKYKNIFSKGYITSQVSCDLVTFTDEILNGKLYSLCSACQIGLKKFF